MRRGMPPASERAVAFDVLRVFAALCVVAIHILRMYRAGAEGPLGVAVVDDLLDFAVPLFVFISGMLVWGRPGAHDAKTFWARRLDAIVLPYLAWSAVYLAILAASSADPGEILRRAPVLLLTGETWYHLYFVPMLLVLYAAAPIARRLVRTSPESLLLAAFVARILLAEPLLASAGAQGMSGSLARLAFHVVVHLPEMALGAWYWSRRERLGALITRVWPLLIGAGLGVQAARSLSVMPEMPGPVLSAVLAVAMASTVLGWTGLALASTSDPSHRQRARAHALADLTFGVYLVHPLFIHGLERAREAAGIAVPPAWWFATASFVAVAALSAGTVLLLSRTPARKLAATRRTHPPHPHQP